MKALFIGRFQPFHKGHLKVIKDLSKKYDEVIIGIGSSQYRDTIDNPFSFEERKMMIERSLEKNSIKNYRIVSIPDIHNPPKWVDHVLSIVSDFDVVVSNNSFTKKLFEERNYKVEGTKMYRKDVYSGKEIRKRIKNDEKWKHLLPKPVIDLILEVDGVKRIKNL